MGIIQCTECNHEFSDKAEQCPNCGCPTSEVINSIYQSKNTINICGVDYDLTDIFKKIENGLSWNEATDVLAELIGEPPAQVYYICKALQNNDFSPWHKDRCGFLVNTTMEEQQKENEARLKQKRQNTPHCPVCNSTNIKKIGMTGKASILGLGLLSSDIGKQFKCKDCGNKW